MTATWWDDQNHADQKEWPDKRVNGWAPGNYTCTCADCGVRYLGDKRSVQCFPCSQCAGQIIQKGISAVFYGGEPRMDLGAAEALAMFADAGVEVYKLPVATLVR